MVKTNNGTEMRYLIFFLRAFFTYQPLDWKNSKWGQQRSPVGMYITYKGNYPSKNWLLSFIKLNNASRYTTSIQYLSEPVLTINLENTQQLRKIAGKEYRTLTSGHVFKMPSMWELMKYFYK